MAKHYRIKVKGCKELGFRYYPQYRWVFTPFWFCWWTSYTGYDSSPLAFGELEDAQKSIRDTIKNKADRKKIRVNYLPFFG